MDYRYLCVTWQGLLQMTVYLVSRGYWHYCLTILPEAKSDRWKTIDNKLIDRYQTALSKWQRARRKMKGHANFYYLRWHNLSLLFHTEGTIESISVEDKFADIRIIPMELSISSLVTLSVSVDSVSNKKSHIGVRLNRDSFRGIKASIHETVKKKNLWLLKAEIDRLNGLPAYSGIIRQKRLLAQYAAKQAHKNQLKITPVFFRINTKLKRYPVYSASMPKN